MQEPMEGEEGEEEDQIPVQEDAPVEADEENPEQEQV